MGKSIYLDSADSPGNQAPRPALQSDHQMYFQEPDAQMASVTSQYGEKKWQTGGGTEINHALLVDRPVAKGSLAAAAPPIDATRMPDNAAPLHFHVETELAPESTARDVGVEPSRSSCCLSSRNRS